MRGTDSICLWEKGSSMPNKQNLLKLGLLYKTLSHELYMELLAIARGTCLKKKKRYGV